MSIQPALLWARWFEIYNSGDWEAWDGLIAKDSEHVVVPADGSAAPRSLDRDHLLQLQQGLSAAGLDAVHLSVAALGNSAAVTFRFNGQGGVNVAGIVHYDDQGRMTRSYSITS